MYVPKLYRPENPQVVYSYIEKYAFATLVTQGQRLIASHIPLLLEQGDGDPYLSGHVSKANEILDQLKDGQEVLATFMEHHAYISSSWYDHVNVPTWNYIAVHVYGRATLLTGEDLYHSIENMVNKYESGRTDRFRLKDFSQQELDAHLNGLVGFKISIDRVEAAYKLSQNRKDRDYKEIISQLRQGGSDLELVIAQQMEELR